MKRDIIHKLQKMSGKEVACRIELIIRQQIDRFECVIARNMLSDKAFFQKVAIKEKSANGLLNYIRTRQDIAFFVDEHNKQSILETINKQYPQLVQQAIEKADKICRHEFSFLGIEVKYKEDDIPWTKDPVSLKEWPMKFYTDVNIYGRDIGDVKHVWELNRHQFFIDLGKAYWLSGDEGYAKKFFALITSWIDNNPYKIGVNWTSALEVAVRGISWLWAYNFCLHSHLLTPETNLKILKSLYQHAQYIKGHLSIFSSPYNHLVGELSALFMIGTVFPDFKEAKTWREESWNMLECEVEKQFHQDGGIVEQATFYQHFTLGFYLMSALLRKMNGSCVSDKVWLYIEKAIEFSMYMIRPDGLIPMIGDVDNARSVYIENPQMWDFCAFLSTGAVLFNRDDMKKVVEELSSYKGFHEDSLWLLGIDAMKKYQEIKGIHPEVTSKVLDSSGYCIMRGNWGKDSNYLCFDCGEIAAGLFQDSTPSAAHGHADILSFELSAFGYPMIIDPGFYTYNGDEHLHYYFRQTRAHNTIVVDGQSQAKEAGKLSWSNVPECRLEKWIANKGFDLAIGSHDGYKPVIHKRAVLFKKNEALAMLPEYWIIHDFLEGYGEHLIESYLHLVPDVKIGIEEKTIVVQHPEGIGLVIQSIANMLTLDVDVIDTGNIPDGGWLAPGYGSLMRALILRYHGIVRLPCEITTVIYPFKGNLPPCVDQNLVEEDICMIKR